MAGGKGKSTGGKAGPKDATTKSQKSHSAKAGLQVCRQCSLSIVVESATYDASFVDGEALLWRVLFTTSLLSPERLPGLSTLGLKSSGRVSSTIGLKFSISLEHIPNKHLTLLSMKAANC